MEEIMNYPYRDQFASALVTWFEREQRDLPWRKTKDPYKIWVSEVMLQQTRVDTVIPYYERFMKSFPTVQALADADEEVVLKHWEGLGYYSRARNLQSAVREVHETYGGIVPNTREEMSTLKGVGPYTAGAVLSIAYGVPEHAVDGNVMRVLSRVLNCEEDIAKPKTKPIFEKAVMFLIDHNNPSYFNQGLMELGALVCTKGKPHCLLCPVQAYCLAYQEGKPEDLPVKTKKVKNKPLHYAVVVHRDGDKFYVEQRPSTGLLSNMWQFPMYDNFIGEPIMQFKHVFSHLTWHIKAYYVTTPPQSEGGSFKTLQEIEQLPMPVPMLKILDFIKIEMENL